MRKKIIIKEFHETLLRGHQGVSRTMKRIIQHYTLKGLNADIKEYIKLCASCQKNKSSNHSIQQPMVVTTTAGRTFEIFFLNIVGLVDLSCKSNSYILTIQYDLSKYSTVVPLPDHTANTVSQAFIEHFVCLHGIPNSIVTDQGREFMGKVFSACCKLLKIKKINTTAYHSQSNGVLERSPRTSIEYLRHFVQNKKQDWDQYVAYAMFVYNSSVHTATGFQPHELVYGYPIEVPHTLSKISQKSYKYEDYTNELRQKMQESFKLAKDRLIDKK
jgi:transposase InsO family protein